MSTATENPTPAFTLGQKVKHTDRQGVVTFGKIDMIEPMPSYYDPTKIASIYYGIDTLGTLSTDGFEAATA